MKKKHHRKFNYNILISILMDTLAIQMIFGLGYWSNRMEEYLTNFHPDYLDQVSEFPERQDRLRELITTTQALFVQNLHKQIPLDVNLEQCSEHLLTCFDYPLYSNLKEFLEEYLPKLYNQYVDSDQLRVKLILVCQQIRMEIGDDYLSDRTVTYTLLEKHLLSPDIRWCMLKEGNVLIT